MSVAIRMQRGGAKKRPYYRIVIADKRAPRDGAFIEKVGSYNPMLPKDAQRVTLEEERIKHWLGVGAQPSARVLSFLAEAGLAEKADISHRPTKERKRADKKTRKELKAETEAEAAAQAEEEAKAAAQAPAEEAPAEEPAVEEASAEETPAETAEEAAEEETKEA